MTRNEFIKAFAKKNGLPDEATRFASIGVLKISDGSTYIALPCGCGEEGCHGWAMVGVESVPTHLELHSPEPLRSAYLQTVKNISNPHEQSDRHD